MSVRRSAIEIEMDIKGISAPKWDGKTETGPIYIEKFSALAEVMGCGAILDEGTAALIPIKSQYTRLIMIRLILVAS